jgi:hypothetical protein
MKPHVYDKAEYHDDTVQEFELPAEHAANHTVVFLRWLIENGLTSQMFADNSGDVVERFRTGGASIHDVYEWWNCCLVNDMLSDEGNRFAMHYFDFDRGQYLQDYAEMLKGDLPSDFHVEYTEENYRRMKQVMDRRYADWRSTSR